MRIYSFESFLEKKSGRLYKYGCVLCNIKKSNWSVVTSLIDKNDLYKPEDPTHGIENNPHITILFGLHKNVKEEDVVNVFKNVKLGDIDIEMSDIEFFTNDDFDTIKISIKSKKLSELNKELSKLRHTTDFPDYKPHITIAKVLPGTSKKYLKSKNKFKFEGISSIVYSNTNGKDINLI